MTANGLRRIGSLRRAVGVSSLAVRGFSGDPIAVGLVPGLAHPGANVTGPSTLAADLEGKRIELLKELLANLARVAVLSNPTNPFCIVAVESARAAATALHLDLKVVEAAEARDLDRAFVTLSRQRPDAVLIVADPFLTSQRMRVAAFTIESRFPSMYTYREDVLAGGLISYATNYHDVFRRAAILTDKILKGAKPADLPIQQPTKFELVVNLKTAKALGLTIPESFLVRADEVIE